MQFRILVDEKEIRLQPENHLYSLIWLHGMGQTPQRSLQLLLDPRIAHLFRQTRIIVPRTNKKYVKSLNKTTTAWFNIKIVGEMSFKVPTNQAFEQGDIRGSYSEVIKPILERELKILKNAKNIFLGGFSQGCAMAFFSTYEFPQKIGGVFGVSGYMFEITKFDKNKGIPKKLVFGTEDKVRRWEHVRVCFEGRFEPEDVVMVPGMGHESTREPVKLQMIQFFKNQLIMPKL